jgi:hypothetical protein
MSFKLIVLFTFDKVLYPHSLISFIVIFSLPVTIEYFAASFNKLIISPM